MLRLRTSYFTAVKFGKRESDVRRGKTSFHNGHSVTLSFEDVLSVVSWSLSNCIFTIGKKFSKQILGCPMGDPMSPPLAIITCAFSEFCFLKSLGADERSLSFGSRYVDDLCSFSFSYF